MGRKILIVLGLVLGGLSAAGSLVRLIAGANDAVPALVISILIFLFALQHHNKEVTKHDPNNGEYRSEESEVVANLNSELTVIVESRSSIEVKKTQGWKAIENSDLPIKEKNEIWHNFIKILNA